MLNNFLILQHFSYNITFITFSNIVKLSTSFSVFFLALNYVYKIKNLFIATLVWFSRISLFHWLTSLITTNHSWCPFTQIAYTSLHFYNTTLYFSNVCMVMSSVAFTFSIVYTFNFKATLTIFQCLHFFLQL